MHRSCFLAKGVDVADFDDNYRNSCSGLGIACWFELWCTFDQLLNKPVAATISRILFTILQTSCSSLTILVGVHHCVFIIQASLECICWEVQLGNVHISRCSVNVFRSEQKETVCLLLIKLPSNWWIDLFRLHFPSYHTWHPFTFHVQFGALHVQIFALFAMNSSWSTSAGEKQSLVIELHAFFFAKIGSEKVLVNYHQFQIRSHQKLKCIADNKQLHLWPIFGLQIKTEQSHQLSNNQQMRISHVKLHHSFPAHFRFHYIVSNAARTHPLKQPNNFMELFDSFLPFDAEMGHEKWCY